MHVNIKLTKNKISELPFFGFLANYQELWTIFVHFGQLFIIFNQF